jgi:HK97 family phage portal protein
MTTKLLGSALGRKAVSLDQLDQFLDWLVTSDLSNEPQDLYAAVAWTFWSVNMRADALASVPYGIYRIDTDEDTEENEAPGWELDLAPILWTVEAWLCLKAAAYIFKRDSSGQSLQVLNANSMQGDKDSVEKGKYTQFIQRVGPREIIYPAKDIVYFRTFNPRNDIGPGIASGQVGQRAGSLVRNANEWAVKFFENGAIPLAVLKVPGTMSKEDKGIFKEAWNKLLRGVAKAFNVAVLERGADLQVIGQPVKDLTMPELERTKKEQILAAHKIPPGLGDSRTNRATQEFLELQFWTKTVQPQARVHIMPVLNEQLLNPLGLRIGFRFHEIEAIQTQEIAKAESVSFLFNGAMLPAYEANTVKIEEVRRVLNELLVWVDLPGLDEQFEPEERTPPQLLVANQQAKEETEASETEQGRPQRRGENPPKAFDDDLRKWRRVALRRLGEGKGALYDFQSENIPPGLHRDILDALETADTEEEVKAAFAAGFWGERQTSHAWAGYP